MAILYHTRVATGNYSLITYLYEYKSSHETQSTAKISNQSGLAKIKYQSHAIALKKLEKIFKKFSSFYGTDDKFISLSSVVKKMGTWGEESCRLMSDERYRTIQYHVSKKSGKLITSSLPCSSFISCSCHNVRGRIWRRRWKSADRGCIFRSTSLYQESPKTTRESISKGEKREWSIQFGGQETKACPLLLRL